MKGEEGEEREKGRHERGESAPGPLSPHPEPKESPE